MNSLCFNLLRKSRIKSYAVLFLFLPIVLSLYRVNIIKMFWNCNLKLLFQKQKSPKTWCSSKITYLTQERKAYSQYIGNLLLIQRFYPLDTTNRLFKENGPFFFQWS